MVPLRFPKHVLELLKEEELELAAEEESPVLFHVQEQAEVALELREQKEERRPP